MVYTMIMFDQIWYNQLMKIFQSIIHEKDKLKIRIKFLIKNSYKLSKYKVILILITEFWNLKAEIRITSMAVLFEIPNKEFR